MASAAEVRILLLTCLLFSGIVALITVLRRDVVRVDLKGLPPAFVEGVKKGCAALGMTPVFRIGDDECVPDRPTITARPEMFGGSACPSVVAYVDDDARNGDETGIVADRLGLFEKAAEVARDLKSAHRFLIVRGRGDPEIPVRSGAQQVTHVETTASSMYVDASAAIMGRIVDAVVVTNPDLGAHRDPLMRLNGKLLIAVGFKHPGYDVCVYYDAFKQGYLAAILAKNVARGKPRLHTARRVETKMYVDIRNEAKL